MKIYVITRLVPSESGGNEEFIGCRTNLTRAKNSISCVQRDPMKLLWKKTQDYRWHSLDGNCKLAWTCYDKNTGIHYIIRRVIT